ncbi:MAG TPA: hypothetical protein VD908_20195 [Cytophagales bacterium]|nr:hypothetical protein [Cytophagales bacterium]
MAGLQFWKEWVKPFRTLYFFLLSIFLLVIIFYLISYYLGVNNLIPWETSSAIQHLKFTLDDFELGIFKIQVPSFTYIIEERFKPGNLELNLSFAYAFLIIIFSSLAIVTAVITTLNRSYFLLGFAALIFSFLLFKFEYLGIFGVYEKYVFVALILLIGGVAYYFHAFRPDTSFFKRLTAFVALYAFILIISTVFSEEKQPLLSLVSYGILFTGILSILFIIFVSHEIVYGFLFLVTYSSGPGSRNTAIHFIVVSLLYFLCLFLIYFKSIDYLDLQIFGTDAFLILPFSVLIGFYGLKAREFTFQNIVSFAPAALLYITLAILSFSTLTYVFVTYNDPAIEAFQDFIIYSHIGIGIMFFIYILANFSPLLGKNLNVYKVVYKPERFPFYIVRLGGAIFIVAFLVKADLAPINRGFSGYLNGLGDLSIAQNNIPEAYRSFQLAKEFDHFNHKSNYTLAQLYLGENKEDKAIEYLEESFVRKPSAQGYVQLSNIYLNNDLYFDAIYSLRKGSKTFPEDAHIYNNLGLLYNKTALADSAFIFLNSARKFSQNNSAINGNYWSFLARNITVLNFDADSIVANENTGDYLSSINNKLALLNLADKKFNGNLPEQVFKDTILSEEKFSLITNYSLNRINLIDSAALKRLTLAEKSENESSFNENVTLLKGTLSYYNYDVKNAFFLLNKLKVEGVTNVGYYNLLMGIWSLENKAYLLAVDYFNAALEKGTKDAFFYRAIALSEAGNKVDAISAWENVAQLNDPGISNLAAAMGEIIRNEDFSSLFSLNDDYKYQALRFKFNDLTKEQRDALSQTFSSDDYRYKAKLLEAEKAWENGDAASVEEIISALKQESINNNTITGQINLFYLKLNIGEYNPKNLREFLSNSFINEKYWPYFTAQVYANQNKEADTLYQQALKALPFQFDVVNNAVAFYNKNGKAEDAYNISLEAVKLNPYSSPLLKLYILQSLNVNLDNYAADGLEKLKEITSPEDYRNFEVKFEEEKRKKESSTQDWQ